MKVAYKFSIGLGVALIFAGCMSDSGSGTGGPGGSIVQNGTYSVNGNTLTIVTDPQPANTCEGDVLHPGTRSDTLVFGFTQAGDALTIIQNVYTLNSGAVVEMDLVFNRVGSGAGLEGSWGSTGSSYQVLSTLQPTAIELALLDLYIERANYTSYSVAIAPNRVTWTRDKQTAALFLANWNGLDGVADSATHNITVRVVGPYTNEMIGLTTTKP